MTATALHSEVLHLQSSNHRPALVMCLTGVIDLATVGELQAEIRKLLTEERPARLIVDLSKIAHIDSSGIGALLEGLDEANQMHVSFILCGLNQAIRRVLERTRLNFVFDIRPTVAEGLQIEAMC